MDDPVSSGPPRGPEDGVKRSLPVDFRDEDGLYRGELGGGTDDGIHGEGQTGKPSGPAPLVPYGRVYVCEKSVRPDLSEEMQQEKPLVVEVLVRMEANQSLQWHRALLSLFDDGSNAHGLASTVLPTSTVSVTVRVNPVQSLLTEWENVTEEVGRGLAARTAKGSIVWRQLKPVKPFRAQAPSGAKTPNFASAEDSNSRPAKRLKSEASVEACLELLPAVILTEIFEFLDTPARYRSVCSYWNCVLTMPRILSQQHLNYTGQGNSNLETVKDLNAVCASKCWAPTIIISVCADRERPVCSAVGILCRILQEFHHTPPRIIIATDLRWSYDNATMIKDLELVSQNMTLRNITILFNKNGDDGEPAVRLRIGIGHMVGGQQPTVRDWMNMINEKLPALGETEMTSILDSAAEYYRKKGRSIDWEGIKQDFISVQAKLMEEHDWYVTSQVSLPMDNPSAKDLVKLEVQKLPKLLQRCFLAKLHPCAVLNCIISW